ncbi:MAG TPA: FliA/WhiG family RNA polymerase sigma factor [Clostridia bacterium]|nr:FliA/WhiG family RNA polymerase sigma factor [Clostridia bacterium]
MNEQCVYSKREEDILRYLPLVQSVVDRMGIRNKQNMERDDLVNMGIIGLMDAMSKYDASQKIPFEHYAKWRIRGTILDELRKNGLVSRDRMGKVNRLYDAVKNLQQQLLREPSDDEIRSYLGIGIEKLHEIYQTVHFLSQYSLEGALFKGDQQEYSLKDILVDEKAEDPVESFEKDEKSFMLTNAIKGLKEREKLILNLYYFEELPLKDIAVILGVSISRVSQIHGKSLIKLRNRISKEEERMKV